jgi:hypothetical protein
MQTNDSKPSGGIPAARDLVGAALLLSLVQSCGESGPAVTVTLADRPEIQGSVDGTPGGSSQRSSLAGDRPSHRVQRGQLTTDGFAIEPDSSTTFPLRFEEGARLRFSTSLAKQGQSSGQLVVRIGDHELVTRNFEAGLEGELQRHEVIVTDSEAGDQELVFEGKHGDRAILVHEPLLLPPNFAGARDEDSRPDILFIVADTLRADALGTYGGPEGLTPRLDAIAADSLVFERAMASSSWTLPSHASMLTGLHPHQHGATEPSRALPDVGTIAEVLSRAGYRTGAVTNGAFVSAAYGMDRGFQSFEEYAPSDMEGTLRAAAHFLADSDSRPSFLFLHTYRAHTPYHAATVRREALASTLDTSASDAAQVGILQAARSLRDEGEGAAPLLRLVRAGLWGRVIQRYLGVTGGGPESTISRVAEPLQSLYLVGINELDDAIGQFMDELNRIGVGEELVTVFTSDHGEAFGEDGDWFHGHGVSDSVLHVPLLIHGKGLKAGRFSAPASSVDLPRTLAAIAGVEALALWGGRSLLDPAPPGTVVLSFDCAIPGEASVRLTSSTWRVDLPDLGGSQRAWSFARFKPLYGSSGIGGEESLEQIRARYGVSLGAAFNRVRGAFEIRPAGTAPGLDDLGY